MSKDREKLGRWDFDGACKPGNSLPKDTFSVSIFQWVQKKSGGLKKSKSVYRVKGSFHYPEQVYKRAGEICDFLDNGGKLFKKSETVS